jgi:hypothetical protein
VQSIWIEKSQNDTQMLLDQLVGFEETAEQAPTTMSTQNPRH